MKERLLYIDRLKGITILLVVIGHFIQYNTVESTNNSIFELIYSFHMPLFMFISGYVAHKSIDRNIFKEYFTFIQKKTRTLIIPFLSWGLIINQFLFNSRIDSAKNINGIQKTFISLINGGGLWFLWFLFFLTILYTIFLFISDLSNKKNSIIIDTIINSFLLCLLLGIKYYNVINFIDSFILYYFFFFVGVYYSKYAFLKETTSNRNVVSLFIILFAIIVGWYEFQDQSNFNLLIKVLCSLLAIVIIYQTINNIKLIGFFDKHIRNWGQNSLVIYVTHFKIVSLLSLNLLIPHLGIFAIGLISIIFSIAVIMTCILVLNLVQLFPLLNLLLYGNLKRIISNRNLLKCNNMIDKENKLIYS